MVNGFFPKGGGLTLSAQRRTTSIWTVGQPGTGKSRAIASWVMNDIRNGRGVAVFDPHQDLFRHIARASALLAEQDYELASKVVLVDPLDDTWAVGFNPLQVFAGMSAERLAVFFTDVAFKIWRIEPSDAPRMNWLMVHTFAALAELGLTLVELPLFLRDHEWRGRVMARIQNPEVKDYFLKEFPTSERLRQEWTQSTLNKMGQFVMDPDIKLILGQRQSTINFRDLMDNQKILLVNLPKGELGTEQSQLLGAFLLGMIQQAALSRTDMPINKRKPFYLYLDEFQNYTTDHIQEILSESRKYGLSLILAHQYLEQLPQDLRQAVMNTYGTLVCFRVGYQDAVQLTREAFTPDLPPARRTRWSWERKGQIPVLTPKREYGSLEAEWERLIRELTTLPPRFFWARQKGVGRALKQWTMNTPDPNCPPALLDSLITLSGVRYASRKNNIRRELLNERPRLLAELAGGHPPDEAIMADSGLPPKWSD